MKREESSSYSQPVKFELLPFQTGKFKKEKKSHFMALHSEVVLTASLINQMQRKLDKA